MLTFLRKIRKSLIESGSARKYLLYAIGEILLVMIGILMALQVNNWNEERKNEVVRQVYLKSLIIELNQNIALKDFLEPHFNERIASFDRLFEELNKFPINMDSLEYAQENTVEFIGTASIHKLAFEELITSNNLRLFEKGLRDQIMSYYSNVVLVLEGINVQLQELREIRRIYWLSTDMAYAAGFKDRESSAVKNWRKDPDSPQFVNATNFFTWRKQTTSEFINTFRELSDDSEALKLELENHIKK